MDNTHKASSYQFICLMILFIISESLVYGIANDAEKDIWIVILICIVVSFFFYQFYFKVMDYYPGQGMFNVCELVFGNFIGRTISMLISLYALYTATLIVIDFKSILIMIHLTETPEIVILLFYGLLMIYSAKSGIVNISRCSVLFINFIIGFLLIVTAFQVPAMNIDNILPILQTGPSVMAKSVFSAFTFPFGEIFIFMAFMKGLKNPRDGKKIFIIAYLIGAFVLLTISMSQLLILGIEEYRFAYFPAFMAVARIDIHFLQGLELLISVALILSTFFKMVVYLLVACMGCAKTFGLKGHKAIVTPYTIFTVLLTLIHTKSMMYHWEWIGKYWPYFSTPFIIFFPIILFIGAFIKNRKKSKSAQ